MELLKFRDMKAKKSFETSIYRIVERPTRRGNKRFAIAKSPFGDNECWRIIGKAK